eukprot:TRINITY_DN1808_c0_g1_i1.p1 TRINITY_DN1808_c0_g1~~TRINITY_DN1808_c0_g1_i1.p1  ORF type:complete len:727 (-),score=129.89 TRINITY_DN1808_c0_g1_i1:684-2864(-)
MGVDTVVIAKKYGNNVEPQFVYSAGDLFEGVVRVCVTKKPAKLKAVLIRVMGVEKTSVTVSTGSGKNRNTHTYRESFLHLDETRSMLSQQGQGSLVTLDIGTYTFGFAISLPQHLVPSLSASHASIVYTVTSRVKLHNKGLLKSNPKSCTPMKIFGFSTISQLDATLGNPVNRTIKNKFMFGRGSVNATVTVARGYAVAGRGLVIDVMCDLSKCKKSIQKIRVRLSQVITRSARSHVRTETTRVYRHAHDTTSIMDKDRDGEHSTQIRCAMPGNLNCTFNGKYLNVAFVLQVVFCSTKSSDFHVTFPLWIAVAPQENARDNSGAMAQQHPYSQSTTSNAQYNPNTSGNFNPNTSGNYNPNTTGGNYNPTNTGGNYNPNTTGGFAATTSSYTRSSYSGTTSTGSFGQPAQQESVPVYNIVEETRGLPPGWGIGCDAHGRTFYINHTTRTTQWDPPIWNEKEASRVFQRAPPTSFRQQNANNSSTSSTSSMSSMSSDTNSRGQSPSANIGAQTMTSTSDLPYDVILQRSLARMKFDSSPAMDIDVKRKEAESNRTSPSADDYDLSDDDSDGEGGESCGEDDDFGHGGIDVAIESSVGGLWMDHMLEEEEEASRKFVTKKDMGSFSSTNPRFGPGSLRGGGGGAGDLGKSSVRGEREAIKNANTMLMSNCDPVAIHQARDKPMPYIVLPGARETAELPPGWVQRFTPGGGKPYYINHEKCISTFDRPMA